MAAPENDRDASGDGEIEDGEQSEGETIYSDPKETGLWSGNGPGILYKLLIESR